MTGRLLVILLTVIIMIENASSAAGYCEVLTET